MMSDLIGIDITGDEELIKKLQALPLHLMDAGVENANRYMLNIERQNAPSHKGEPFRWTSEKQRRYVHATVDLPYTRTQSLSRGWQLLGTGRNQILVNEVPYAPYLKTLASQQIGHMLRGWTTIEEDVKDHEPRMVQKFDEGVRKAIKQEGLE
jgi:hypothetical protein